MRLAKFMAAQLRKPAGWFGRRVMAHFFDHVNARINDLTVGRLEIQPSDHVLEIGFGSAYTFRRMTALVTTGRICGVDFSEAMVERAERRFRRPIDQGQVEVRLGDISHLPYPDGAFDKVCSVNTLYFWQSPAESLAEIRRVMKHGGRVILSFRSRGAMERQGRLFRDFKLYEPAEVKELLKQASFKGVHLENNNDGKRFDAVLAIGSK